MLQTKRLQNVSFLIMVAPGATAVSLTLQSHFNRSLLAIIGTYGLTFCFASRG